MSAFILFDNIFLIMYSLKKFNPHEKEVLSNEQAQGCKDGRTG